MVFPGNWEKYVETIYDAFSADFLGVRPNFLGKPLNLKRHPEEKGRVATFWHFISEGKVESERTPNFKRCERIRWPRAFIENYRDPSIKAWRTVRAKPKGKETRIILLMESENYVVILADRGSFILPWTAYYLDRSHTMEKLLREFDGAKKAGDAF